MSQHLADARAVVADAFILGLRPPPKMTVSAWAEANRQVSAESGSPFPGPWLNTRTPYGVEPMDCLSPADPCTDVTFVGTAQVIKSEVGVNFVGFSIDAAPAPMLIVLPSIDESHKFNRTKLQPTIDATPALKHKVKEVKSRDENGSTASNKRFRGGFIQLTHAGSSKGLQAITVKHIWGDEVSEFPHDAGGRGDPIAQMRERSSIFLRRGGKALWTSTTRLKGSCRISAMYEASDQRRWYWECPHCRDYFVLKFEHLKWDSPRAPHGTHVVAPCCGGIIAHWQKPAMLETGLWLKTFPAAKEDAEDKNPSDVVARADLEKFRARKSLGRQPGFHLWRGQSAFHDWDSIVKGWLEAQGEQEKLKTFTQQILAEAFEEAGESPDHLKLMARKEDRVSGRIPDGVLALTGFADVQQNRLQWSVWGWGRRMTSWLIDRGVIEGDPESDEVWQQLANVIAKRYEDPWGRDWPIEAFGVDSGYKSHAVYNFTRRRAGVFATDGRAGATRPLVGTPKKVDVTWRGKTVKGGAMLWPIGVDPMKSALYSALTKTIEGPNALTGLWPEGCVRFTHDCDEAFFQQLTAEYLKNAKTRDGRGKQMWVKRAGHANEELDIWVGSRAMAAKLGLDRYTPNQWQARIALRSAPDDQMQKDLLAQMPKASSAPTQQRGPARRSIPSGYV